MRPSAPTRALLAAITSWLWCATPARADPHVGDDREKLLVATRLRGSPPPVIDGRLDDAAWREVHPDDRFTQNFPDEGAAPSQRTELLVLYDDASLYLALRCHDTDPARIVEWLTRRDRDTSADKVTVDIDSRHDRGSAYHFDVNVSGVLADGLRFNESDQSSDWDGQWTAATTRDDGGWSVEIEIPWSTLRFDGKAPRMGLQVRRYIARRQEVDEWAFIPRTEHAEVSRYGSLGGLDGLGSKRLVQLQPYVAIGAQVDSVFGDESGALGVPPNAPGTGSTSAGLPRTVAHAVPNLGLDAKIGLTSSLTLDATINPDFGQLEADPVVLNLTTFETFYPEKRPFFLEGTDLFATPILQFYTRRIGRPPPSPNLDESQILDEPLIGRIWGAAKLSGQVVPHLSIALLDAVTAEQLAAVQLDSGSPIERRLVDPTTNFGVIRLRSDWGASYFGATATAVTRFEGANAAAPHPGDPCPYDPQLDLYTTLLPGGGRCTHDAYTASADTRLQTIDGTWALYAQLIGSLIAGGPTRVLRDGTHINPGDGGFGLSARAGKFGGERILFSVRYEGYSPTLDLNDAGYLRTANSHAVNGGVTLRTTHPLGPTLESAWEVFGNVRTAWDGTIVDAGVGTGPWARFASFWQAWIGFGYTFDHWDNRDAGDGTIVGRVGGLWAELWVKSDPRRALTAELNLHVNRTLRGASTNGDLTVGFRPRPQIEVQLIPRFVDTWGDPRAANRDPIEGYGYPRRYWFADLWSTSFDVTLRGIYTFTPRLSFQLYAQLFVAGGHFSNWTVASVAGAASCPAGRNPCAPARIAQSAFQSAPSQGGTDDWSEGDINLNALLRWEFRPGSTLIAVYTRAQSQLDFNYGPETTGGISFARFGAGRSIDTVQTKFTYLWR